MTVNFTSTNEGTWFYFDDKNSEGGGVCLRELIPNESLKIDKLATRKAGRLGSPDALDAELRRNLIWDYCIVDWKSIQLDGVDLECNRENKAKIMGTCIDFVKFVTDCLDTLVSNNKALEGARLKNLEPISSGN